MALRLAALVAFAVTVNAQPLGGSSAAAAPTDAPQPVATPKPTPSPLDRYHTAEHAADAAMATLESEAGDLHSTAGDQSRIDTLGESVLVSTSGDKHGLKDSQKTAMEHMRALAEAAKDAASEAGKLADMVRQSRKVAGGNASVYEASYEKRSARSEEMERHAGELGQQASHDLKDVYSKIKDGIKQVQRAAKDVRREQEREADAKVVQAVYAKQSKERLVAAKQAAAAKAQDEAEAAAKQHAADIAAAKEQAAEQAAKEAAASSAAAEAEAKLKAAEDAAAQQQVAQDALDKQKAIEDAAASQRAVQQAALDKAVADEAAARADADAAKAQVLANQSAAKTAATAAAAAKSAQAVDAADAAEKAKVAAAAAKEVQKLNPPAAALAFLAAAGETAGPQGAVLLVACLAIVSLAGGLFARTQRRSAPLLDDNFPNLG